MSDSRPHTKADFESALANLKPFWGTSSFAELDEAMYRLERAYAAALVNPEWAARFAERYKELCAGKEPFIIAPDVQTTISEYRRLLESINWDLVEATDKAYVDAKAIAFHAGDEYREMFNQYDVLGRRGGA